jgi:hypothetical protein
MWLFDGRAPRPVRHQLLVLSAATHGLFWASVSQMGPWVGLLLSLAAAFSITCLDLPPPRTACPLYTMETVLGGGDSGEFGNVLYNPGPPGPPPPPPPPGGPPPRGAPRPGAPRIFPLGARIRPSDPLHDARGLRHAGPCRWVGIPHARPQLLQGKRRRAHRPLAAVQGGAKPVDHLPRQGDSKRY